MKKLKVLEEEFPLYIDEIEKVQEKFDILLSMARLIGYRVVRKEYLSYYPDGTHSSFILYLVNFDKKSFLFEFYFDELGNTDRIVWIIDDTIDDLMKTCEWMKHESDNELMKFFDKLMIYI